MNILQIYTFIVKNIHILIQQSKNCPNRLNMHKMTNSICYTLIIFTMISCGTSTEQSQLNDNILKSLGHKYKLEFGELTTLYEEQLKEDSINVSAYVGLAESKVLLYVFGYIPREECMPRAWQTYEVANALDSLNSDVRKLAGILHYLDWNWIPAEREFKTAIKLNSSNLNARHWYSLWLMSMNKVEESMAQSDTIMSMDTDHNYRIGRASIYYFRHMYEEMKTLMLDEIEDDPSVPWAYDWLGMAYNGLEEHDQALETYFKAFELSDGTVEVGAGLGHALGEAGEVDLAKKMADYYAEASKNNYLPYCQRSFIHISIGEHDQALELLEQAYENKSWFLIFMQIEHWYDPIRDDDRFQLILNKMQYPENDLIL